MINRVVLVGRLTADPQLRYTPNGVAVANFTLAVNRPFKNNGEQQADFVQIIVWRKQAENVANYLSKGSLAGVDGRIQTRTFDDKEGNRQYVTEVVAESVQFLDPKSSNKSQSKPQDNNPFEDDPFANDGKQIDINDDDLPF